MPPSLAPPETRALQFWRNLTPAVLQTPRLGKHGDKIKTRTYKTVKKAWYMYIKEELNVVYVFPSIEDFFVLNV